MSVTSVYNFYSKSSSGFLESSEGSQFVVPTRMILMDLPALSGDVKTDGVIYVACYGVGEGWTGCGIYFSHDGGENAGNTYIQKATASNNVTCGVLLEDLGPGVLSRWDQGSSLLIGMNSGTLRSYSPACILSGFNLLYVGGELLNFRLATDLGEGVYRLSEILRGRNGTGNVTHTAGEDVVLINDSVLKLRIESQYFNIEKHYKAVSRFSNLEDTDEIAFTYNLRTFEPYRPVHAIVGRGINGDIQVTWKRSTRVDGDWRDLVDVPISEESESYEVEVYDANDLLLRTYHVASPSVTYLKSEQDNDVILINFFRFAIYQVSALAGRGAKLSVEWTP